MKYIVNNIRMTLDDDFDAIKSAAAKKLSINTAAISGIKIVKESVDARRKPNITMVYTVAVDTDKKIRLHSDDILVQLDEAPQSPIAQGSIKLKNRPLVVGSGPAGLFAGLILAQNGYKPIIIERGQSADARAEAVQRYWKNGVLDTETNVQFGEGGAGTFSDGKLTTRINDRRGDIVLEEFVKSGAPEEILYKSKPHIGSDKLQTVVVNMRKRIEQLGGEVRFGTRLDSLAIKNGNVTGAVTNAGYTIDTEVVVLAIGHSARDTFKALLDTGIEFVQKPFSIGVRIEHPQKLIDNAQNGKWAGHPRLGAADYQLFRKIGDRTVYSFCMCPGGVVVASASEKDMIVTNGMSYFARDMENANSALVVSVQPGDYGSSHPLAGVDFQRQWERKAYNAGGGGNTAPVQRLEDFLLGIGPGRLGSVKPSYTGNVRAADINSCLPVFVTAPMKEAAGYFDSRINGFGMKDAVLTGVETRTSSPVRMPRGDSLEAIGFKGIYPAGEGAGYAGGIVSAAVDGIRIAEQIIKTYSQPL